MNLEDKIPVIILHFLERDISKNTCIINEHIDLTKTINCSFDDFISELD
jgi:hypothetical protein